MRAVVVNIRAVVVLGIALVMYVNTTASSHWQAMDSLAYIEAVESAPVDRLFHPHHLLFGPVNRVVYDGFKVLGYSGSVESCMEAVTILSSLACLALVFFLAAEVGASTNQSALCSLSIASTYGYWWYSSEADTYILPQVFLLICLGVLITRVKRGIEVKDGIMIGVLISSATLLHQQYALLMPAVSVGMIAIALESRGSERRRALLSLLATVATATLLVGISYSVAATIATESGGRDEMLDWALGYTNRGLWRPWSATNPLNAVVALISCVWGGQYLLRFDSVEQMVSLILQRNDLLEEKFFASTMSFNVAVFATIATVVSVAAVTYIGVTLSGEGGRPWRRLRERAGGSVFLWSSTSWLTLNWVFVSVWESTSIEFSIAMVPTAILLGFAWVANSDYKAQATPALVVVLASLFLGTLFGSVLPQIDKNSDIWFVSNAPLFESCEEDDLVLTTSWSSSFYLRRYSEANEVVIDYGDDIASTRNLLEETNASRLVFAIWKRDFREAPPSGSIFENGPGSWWPVLGNNRFLLLDEEENQYQRIYWFESVAK